MNDLWGNIELNSDDIVDSKAIEILREQARLLEKKTSGKIKATFSKMEYKKSATEIMGRTILAIAGSKEEIIEAELEGKKDFNNLYNFTEYKFEIFNDTYRFRVFVLKYRIVFPIEIEVDEGIKDELKLSSTELINSDDELKEIVSTVFSSDKLQMIIRRMYAQK